MTDWSTLPLPVERRRVPTGPSPSFADHFWQDGIDGRRCKNCDIRWADALGPDGRACYGEHNDRTRATVEDERDWLWATVVEAAGYDLTRNQK